MEKVPFTGLVQWMKFLGSSHIKLLSSIELFKQKLDWDTILLVLIVTQGADETSKMLHKMCLQLPSAFKWIVTQIWQINYETTWLYFINGKVLNKKWSNHKSWSHATPANHTWDHVSLILMQNPCFFSRGFNWNCDRGRADENRLGKSCTFFTNKNISLLTAKGNKWELCFILENSIQTLLIHIAEEINVHTNQ